MASTPCKGHGFAHRPRYQKKLDEGGKMYFLFTAAEHGCLACVKTLIEDEGVCPNSQSLQNKYTALDFAEWFAKKGKNPTGCEEVAQYLRPLTAPRPRCGSTRRKSSAKEEETIFYHDCLEDAAASGEMNSANNADDICV